MQDAKERAHNFNEVALGYSMEVARDEAKRCLNCKKMPCVSGCPVGVKIPAFISQIAEGDFEGAYQTIRLTNGLPAVCGRVCPQERQCESKCVRGKAVHRADRNSHSPGCKDTAYTLHTHSGVQSLPEDKPDYDS